MSAKARFLMGIQPRGQYARLKSASLAQTQASLELKLIIEQMREQVQNLE